MDVKQTSGPGPVRVPASPPAARPLYSQDREVHLLDRLSAIYEYRRIAATAFLLVVLGVVVRTYTTVPMYRSTSHLLIEDEHPTTAARLSSEPGSEWGQDPSPYYQQTQFRVLTSRGLARRVVRRLHLESVPEFNGTGAQPTSLGAFLRDVRAQVMTPLRALVGKADSPRAAPRRVSEDGLIDAFLSHVSVEPIRNSRLVDISFVSADPAFAARAADTLVDEYVQQNLELGLQTTEKSLAWLSQELVKQQGKVEASERALAQYREVNNALSLEDRQNIVVARLNQLNDAVTRAKTARVQKEVLYNQITSLGATAPADTIAAIIHKPSIKSIKNQLAELEREEARLSERYGGKHPEIIKINASLQNASKQLESELAKAVEAVGNDYHSALAEESKLTAALEEQKDVAMDLNRKGASYTVLEREAQSNRQLYEALLQREKELQVVNNSRGNNVRMMDHAQVPDAPFRPDPKRNLLLGALAGLVFAIGLSLGVEYLDDTIKTPDDIIHTLKMPLLELIPSVEGGNHPLLTAAVPYEFAEAFRSLRTSLVFSCGGESTRLVLVTSAQALEGKTTTACNLAIALSYSGARVLLVDADMRKPSVHRTMGLENTRGLSDLLTGQAPAAGVVHRLADPDLWVMTAGRTPLNPAELLASVRMNAFLTDAQKGPFDWVIIDTPPVLAATDAVILTPWVSGIAFVIGSQMTRRRLAERAIETLAKSQPRILGAVLNRVDVTRNKYYYARYYGYGKGYQRNYARGQVA
jgi:capsular exopolysaccharide synthesis family protein